VDRRTSRLVVTIALVALLALAAVAFIIKSYAG